SPVIVAILTVYFVQGALGLSRLAVTFYLKDDLHLSPVDAAVLTGFSSLPWVIKPLYGFLSDGFPIFGYKRRSYLVLAGLLGSLSWVALGTVVNDANSALAAIIAGSAAVAVSDVVADSIVGQAGEVSMRDTAGDLQSLCWGSAAFGSLLSAYFSGSLLQTVTPKTVFLFTSLFPLLTAGASLLIDEQKTEGAVSFNDFKGSVGVQLSELLRTFRNPAIYLPVLFVFLWQATPSADSALFYFSTNELKFQPEFLGRVRLASSAAALAGVLAYRTWFKNVPVRDLIFWTTLVSVPLGLTQVLLTTHYNRVLGIPDELFSLTDSVVLTVLGQVAFMPVLALAASLCPPGVEGTLFATLMSIYNAAGALGSELGAGLTSVLGITDTNFENLPILVVICSLSSLLPLAFI
ncbi:folate-biopterin transporter, partial [Ochromonadaceae sp. CCMP2298]